jgi:tetratricopeptide (TPR) repeat protein
LGRKDADRLNASAIAHRDAGRLGSASAAAIKARAVVVLRRGESSPEAAIVWHTIGTIREEENNFAEAGRAYECAADILERHDDNAALTPTRIAVASSMARLQRILGNLSDAESLYLQTIALAERFYESESIELAALLNDLAVVYKYAARLDEAERLYLRALPIIAAQRSQHVDVATVWHNLAGIEYARKRFELGETYARRAVRIREDALGADHVEVARDIAVLASLAQEQQRYAEAEELYQRCLRIFENAYGSAHYDLAVSYNNLAAVYRARGDLAGASSLYRKALEIKERLLGISHPDTAVTMHNLAMLAMQQGDHERARELLTRAVRVFKESLGAEHPKTVVSRGSLTALL